MNKSRADLRLGLYPIYKVDAEARGTPCILKEKKRSTKFPVSKQLYLERINVL
jgi:hypothetical protein